jgi:tetratricopeptide (TPR) repeat protein
MLKAKFLDKIISVSLNLLVFMLPLFFLPLTANYYEFNKNFLLFIFMVILYLFWAIKNFFQKEIRFKITVFTLPVVAIALAFILANLLVSPNKIESLITPNSTGTIILLTLFYFLLSNFHDSSSILYPLIASAAILSLFTVYQFFGFHKTIVPAGGPLPLLMFLAVVFPVTLKNFFTKLKSSFLTSSILGLCLILIFTGLFLTVFQILPGKPNALVILPYPTAWSIAIESFKQSPLFGVGPENFLSAFNRFRPSAYNNSQFWSVSFNYGSNYPLHLLTTTGLTGLASLVWLLITLIRHRKTNKIIITYIMILIAILFVLPVNLISLFTLYLFLALLIPEKKEVIINLSKLAWLPLILYSLICVPVSYFAARAWLSEYYFKKSLTATAQKDGLKTYNYQIKAIELNPKNTNLHLIYSQTNLVLANSLAAKSNLSDEEKKRISELVNQAIREAKIATALNPKYSWNWENLASIYQGLVNFAVDAEKWAILSYQQAIINNHSPRLYLNLGGFFYQLKNFDQAILAFQTAINLKPNYANGYYNLAAAYKELKKYPDAYQALQNALNLIPQTSPDWQKAKNESDELAKLLPNLQATPSAQTAQPNGESLTKPELLPSATGKSIRLPNE